MRRFAQYAWSVLAINLVVILWGAVVRATGSGAGCGSHWPLCNGEVVPLDAELATTIEFIHRATSGIALLLVVALLVWARRVFTAGHPARRAALWSMVFMLGEAAVGAALVLFELTGDNATPARAVIMAIHLGNTFLLLSSLTLTAAWARADAPALTLRGRSPRSLAIAVAAGLGTLLVGSSGAIAALGDTLFPAASHGEAWRQTLSPTAHILLQLRLLHPVFAIAVGIGLMVWASTLSGAAERFGRLLYAAVLVQIAAGALNWWLLAPVWMQIVHLLLADLLWIALTLALAAHLFENSKHRTGEQVPPKRFAPAPTADDVA